MADRSTARLRTGRKIGLAMRRTVLAGFVSLAGAAMFTPLVSLSATSATVEFLERPGDIAMGDPEAPIVMLEYYSLNCPHCAAFHKIVFPDLKRTYIETGKVRFVFRDFPLSWPALEAAVLLHCAGPDLYFGLQDALFKSAREWNVAEGSLQALAGIGEEHGVERAEFKRCLEDGAFERQVLESYKFANEEVGVDGTPTFVINGEKHVGGMSFETLSELFDGLSNTHE